MKLSEILDLLAAGELANLAYAENGVIVTGKIPAIVNAINLGLKKLYTRFKLKRGYVNISITPEVLLYPLTINNVLTISNPTGFILDSEFPDDVLEIVDIKDNDGNSITINDGNLVLLKPTVLKFLKPVETANTYSIEYLALPNKVIYTDDVDIDVELPDVYLNALLMFIASRFYSPVGISFDANRNSMDMSFIQRYEAECQLLESKGFDVDTVDIPNLFTQRGFV